jgi:hypothetical protein
VLNILRRRCGDRQSVNAGCHDHCQQARFNPSRTPVEGVHWRKGVNFGKPTLDTDFQTPRTFRFSVGVRF